VTQLRVPQAQLLVLCGAAQIVQIRIAGNAAVNSMLADQNGGSARGYHELFARS
jgi:hypothetical protein